MFFNLVYVTLAAGACLSWSLPSITEQQVYPQAWSVVVYNIG